MKYCPKCENFINADVCPNCGWSINPQISLDSAKKPRSRLFWFALVGAVVAILLAASVAYALLS